MSTSDITTKIYFASGSPSTFDESGYDAMTWTTQAKGVVSVGAVGVTTSIIDVPDLETGFTKGVKGAKAGTVMPIVFREIAGDAGQAAVKAACNEAAHAEYSMKILEPSGAIQYVTGAMHDWTRNERSTTSYAGFTCNMRLNFDSVEVAAS